MTSRQRVQTALRHQEPDRVPVDFWSTPQMDAKLLARLKLESREDLLRTFGVDFRYLAGPPYIGPALAAQPNGISYDLWGVPRAQTTITHGDWQESYSEVKHHPLAHCRTPADVVAYEKWPSPDWFDYSVIPDQCEACEEACVVFAGDRLNRIAQLKPAMYLRGIDQILVDMLLAPDIFAAIIGRIRDFCLEYEGRILEAAAGKIDLLMMGDDFGTQHGLMMSLTDWRRWLKPGLAAFIELAHRYQVPVMHHTCGAITELIPDFIDCGLDILQGLQPGVRGMDHALIKQEFGRELAFHSGVSIQHALPHGTPQQVREEVRQLFATLKPGGGFFAGTSHSIQADTPVDNVLALVAACHEFGAYHAPP